MRFLKNKNGFTLIEVLVAVVILVIVVLAISTLMMQGYRTMGAAGKRSESLLVALEEIETAITDPDYDPGAGADEETEVSREPHNLHLFGQTVRGTQVTVKRAYPGHRGGEVTYTYFIVDGVED